MTKRRKKPAEPESESEPAEDGGQDAAEPAGGETWQPAVPFPVVGIGASAGGLEAFTELLRNLPTDTGMAFVILQHFGGERPSMLPEILQRETAMPVREAAGGLRLEPDHVYVLAAHAALSLDGRNLHLEAVPEMRARHMPIDHFFHALAEAQGNRAVGVVLSGTASDGTLGLRAIQAAGGITLVQEPASAGYDGMPRSAMAAGVATFVLAPARLAAELARIGRHPYLLEVAPARPTDEEGGLQQVFATLRRRTGVDFSQYKRSTVLRRLNRRMVVHQLEEMDAYVALLEAEPAEQDALYRDLLINVTGFFRDPEAFRVLQERVFPALTADRSPDTAIRIWVPGCASGEEVYSIAIALLEYLEDAGAPAFPLQLFGTDLDEQAIDTARAGIYPESIAQDLTPGRLRRFFTKVDQGYQISRAIRDACVFSRHNVVRDPPFSRLDLVSCRNLLIYLGPALQKRLLPLLHFALKPSGFLLLGSAESVGEACDLFAVFDAKAKLFTKKGDERPMELPLTTARADEPRPGAAAPVPPARRPGFDLHRAAAETLAREFGPAAVVVDADLQIQEFHGATGAYLEPSPGAASLNLLKMAHEGLAAELRAAAIKAVEEGARVRRRFRFSRDGGRWSELDLEVVPLRGEAEQRYFLVVFNEAAPAAGDVPEMREPEGAEDREKAALRQELAATKEYLHSVIEQQERSNEDLRTAHEEVQSGYEELQSTNEELQSTNEELETAKEELQSTNEELRTVNDELENRNAELTRANNDLTNLIASVDIPIVMVGMDLRVRRFTPRARELLNLIETDVGRPVTDIRPNLEVPDIEGLLNQAVDQVQPVEREVQDVKGRWYTVRIRPYRTADNRIDGAVIAYVDIDRFKTALERADRAERAGSYADAVIAAVRHPMLALDGQLRVVSVSQAYLEVFEAREAETVGRHCYQLHHGVWDRPGLRERLEAVLNEGEGFEGFAVEADFPGAGRRRVAVSGRRIEPGPERDPLILMQVEVLGTEG